MLVEKSLLWLVPFACLMLLMVFAMIEFMMALLVKHPADKSNPVGPSELRARLLALNNERLPYQIAEGTDCDFELRWDSPDRKMHYRAWLLLDEGRKEVRGCESMRGRQRVLGMSGTGYQAASGAQMGYLGVDSAVSNAVTSAGWTYRPVLLRFEAKHGGARLLNSLTPGPMKRWSYLRFWGAAYVVTFFAGMLALALALWPSSGQYLPAMLAMSAIWWAFWGFIAWVALGLPRFWIKSQ